MTKPNVVITGSTRGIGLGLAEAFADLGCKVMVSGRSEAAVTTAVRTVCARREDAAYGQSCDVGEAEQVQALWAAAKRRMGRVDVWINNAGAPGSHVSLANLPPREIEAVVRTNLLGTMLGTRVALEGMAQQEGSGQIFNVEGYGANGRMMRQGMAHYGAAKAAVRYFTRSVAKEVAGGNVLVGTVMPGVVVTDMLLDGYKGASPQVWERARRFYNIVADPMEEVAPWLARRILENRRNNAAISRLSIPRMIFRFASPTYRKRDLFAAASPALTA